MAVKDLEDLKKITMLRSQIDGISIERVMSVDFPTVSSEDRISDALSVMRETKYQDVPVVDNGEFMGMVSYASILRKKSVTLDAKVKNFIRQLPSVSPDMEITKISELMVSNNCRQLPVVNGKKVVGVIRRTKLIEIVRDIRALKEIKVWEIMSNPVESVKVNDLMDDALEIMIREDYRTIPVVNETNNVVGIVGMREIIDNNWKKDNKTIGDLEKSARSQITVESIALTSVKTIPWDSDISVAVDMMMDNKISTLPVVEGKDLVGVITEYDIIELLAACRERDMLFVQISGHGEQDLQDLQARVVQHARVQVQRRRRQLQVQHQRQAVHQRRGGHGEAGRLGPHPDIQRPHHQAGGRRHQHEGLQGHLPQEEEVSDPNPRGDPPARKHLPFRSSVFVENSYPPFPEGKVPAVTRRGFCIRRFSP